MDDADIGAAELLVYAVPTQAVRQVARWVASASWPGSLQLSLAKGYELGTLKRPSQVVHEETGGVVAALSGPNHAEEVGRDMPSATVIACDDEGVADVLQRAVTSDTFPRLHQRRHRRRRVLRGRQEPDRRGRRHVGRPRLRRQLAGQPHHAQHRGDDAARSGPGAHLATFTGLAGIGDLIATCTSRHSRNRRAGELLATGATATEVAPEIGQVVEGIPTAYALHDLAGRLGIDMPVTQSVYHVLEGERTPRECVADLMARAPKRERDAG